MEYYTYLTNSSSFNLADVDGTYTMFTRNSDGDIDDNCIDIPLFNKFNFNGVQYDKLYLSSNGNLNFTQNNAAFAAFGFTTLKGLWFYSCDLYVNSSHFICYKENMENKTFTVVFNSSTFSDKDSLVSVKITLYLEGNSKSGDIDYDYGNHLTKNNGGDPYIGFSFGSNNNSDILALDLTQPQTVTAPNSICKQYSNPSVFINKRLTITPTNPNPVSNVCFPANTLITTNQGIIAIQNLDPKIHTIRNKKIELITKTVTQDKYLVCFEKDSLGKNVPSENTIITKNHLIYYKGSEMKAKEFLDAFENVNKIKYNGEVLYNVLLKEHDKMIVNNLICETLHPENKIAQLYKILSDLSPTDQHKVIKEYNDYSIKNNIFSSKR